MTTDSVFSHDRKVPEGWYTFEPAEGMESFPALLQMENTNILALLHTAALIAKDLLMY